MSGSQALIQPILGWGWAELLGWAAVAATIATFLLVVLAAYYALEQQRQQNQSKIAELREGWKERVRWNIARLEKTILKYEARTEENGNLKPEIARQALRLILMLTPDKHNAIHDAIKERLNRCGVNVDESISDVARPVLKQTWEEVEDHLLGKDRKGK